jgi:hypothetical protein
MIRAEEELVRNREEGMPVDTPSLFAQVIRDHLDLKERNARLDGTMPIDRYRSDDPFENHPLFKTEEQARIEDTMDGVQGIEAEETHLDWPTTDDTFIAVPAVDAEATVEAVLPGPADPDQPSDENLWTRSRDFDWGD